MKIEQAFGLALRNSRTERNLSQEKLADISGLHQRIVDYSIQLFGRTNIATRV